MLPVLVSGITSIIQQVLSRFLPETPADKVAEINAAVAAELADNELIKAQIAVNQAEAASPNLFVAGWRPAIGWICASAFAWQFIVLPVLLFVGTVFNHPIQAPVFDTTTMVGILTGMLGLGGMRTVEKINDVNSKSRK